MRAAHSYVLVAIIATVSFLLAPSCNPSTPDDSTTTDDDTSDDDASDDDTSGDDDTAGDDDTTPPCDIMGCDDLPPNQPLATLPFEDMDCAPGVAHSFDCYTEDWHQDTYVIRSQQDLEANLVYHETCIVDFDTQMVIGAQSFDTMDKGDFIDICSIEHYETHILVRYYSYMWEPHYGTGEVGCPHHFVTVERSNAPVEFEETLCVDFGL